MAVAAPAARHQLNVFWAARSIHIPEEVGATDSLLIPVFSQAEINFSAVIAAIFEELVTAPDSGRAMGNAITAIFPTRRS
jgi:hypothetical protein